MKLPKMILQAVMLITCSVVMVQTAQGQAQRTFVSTAGSDANTASLCSRAAPCRGFAAAQTVTLAGGEIIAVDSGGYGAVTLTKAIQLTAPTGVYVAITAFAGDAITINAGASDTVVLRGLTLNGLGGVAGINFQTGRTLHVENAVINGFTDVGILVNRNTADETAEVFIKDTIIRNGNGSGIAVGNTGSNSRVLASLDGCRLERNGSGTAGTAGLVVTDNARVTIRNSVAANNFNGFLVQAAVAGQVAELTIESSVATNNQVGIAAGGTDGSATVRVSNTAITNNTVSGVVAQANGSILSRTNNTLIGNADGNAFPGNYPPQ